MGKHRVIAVDLDDVVVETSQKVLDYYNAKYGTSIKLKDYYSRDLSLWRAPDYDTAIKRVNEYLDTEEYFSLSPTRKSITILREIRKYYALHIVTGRPDFTEVATRKWLKNHFPDIFESVIHTSFFALKGTKSLSKADVCQKLGATLLIDDHLDHAKEAARAGLEVYLFGSLPWNQVSMQLPKGIQRVKNWTEVRKKLLDGDK